MRFISLALAAVVLSGCAQQAPKSNLSFNTFPEAEYAALAKTGTGSVSGQVFMKTRGGDVKVGAGNEVLLIPITSHSRTLYLAYQLNVAPSNTPDPRAKPYTQRMVAGVDGDFAFSNVPPGDYYLAGSVTWETFGSRYASSQQGGFIMMPVTVADGENKRIMLTR
nr:hypothetical protein [Pseudomonas sp. UBA6718]